MREYLPAARSAVTMSRMKSLGTGAVSLFGVLMLAAGYQRTPRSEEGNCILERGDKRSAAPLWLRQGSSSSPRSLHRPSQSADVASLVSALQDAERSTGNQR